MRLPYWVMRWLHRRKLSRHKMRGGKLHSWFGDRILDKALWSPTRESLARAWLIGWPITMVPFLPGQSILAVVAALLVRGNLLLSIGVQFLSNPATAGIQLPACYVVGEIVRYGNFRDAWDRAPKTFEGFMTLDTAKSLYLGGFVIGIIGGCIGYAVIQGTWRERPHPHRRRGGHAPAPSPRAEEEEK